MQPVGGGGKFFLNQINFHSHLERGEIEVDLWELVVCHAGHKKKYQIQMNTYECEKFSQESEK